jgi:hypothetical protein
MSPAGVLYGSEMNWHVTTIETNVKADVATIVTLILGYPARLACPSPRAERAGVRGRTRRYCGENYVPNAFDISQHSAVLEAQDAVTPRMASCFPKALLGALDALL